MIFVVCQDKEVNERLGRIKRANSNLHMATATSYVSKEQPSIADDPNIKNAFYDAPTVITMFAPKNFLFSAEDCAVAAENMMLAADSLGIGSCYLGQGWPAFADPYGQEILKKWNIRTDYYAVMQLLLGYPREGDPHPTGKPRKMTVYYGFRWEALYGCTDLSKEIAICWRAGDFQQAGDSIKE